MALEILSRSSSAASAGSAAPPSRLLTIGELRAAYSAYDLRRFEAYARNLVDYHVIMDLVPTTAMHYFLHRLAAASVAPIDEPATAEEQRTRDLPNVHLTAVQSAVLVAIGLQRKTVEELETELGLPATQLLAMFNKAIRKVSQLYQAIQESEAAKEVRQEKKHD